MRDRPRAAAVCGAMRTSPTFESADRLRNARRNKRFAMRRAVALTLCGALATSSCAARAQAPSSVGEAIGRVLEETNVRAKPPASPDFVVKSRPDRNNLDYTPFSAPEADGQAKKKTRADFEAIGADLDQAAARNREKATRVATPDAQASATKSRSPKKQGANRRDN